MTNRTKKFTTKMAKDVLQQVDLKLECINYRYGLNDPACRIPKPEQPEPESPKGWLYGMEGWQGIKFFLEDFLSETPNKNGADD